MLSVSTAGFLVNAGASLANLIFNLWKTRRQARDKAYQRELDRNVLGEIQETRRQHEALISNLKAEKTQATVTEQQHYTGVLQYLCEESVLLAAMGFDVIFEPVGNGYGLALLIDADLTLALWIPPEYPQGPPEILVASSEGIDEIELNAEIWETDMMLADIVLAIIDSAYMEHVDKRMDNLQ